MFNADLSWRESGSERVGERRHRKERERAATPAGYASSASGPSTPSSGNLEKGTKSSPATLSEKIHSGLRIFGKKRLPPTKSPETPVWRLDRTPTLLQQKNRTPDYLAKSHISPFSNVFSNTSVDSRPGYDDVEIAATDGADQFCKNYDAVKDRIIALQAIQHESSPSVPRIFTSSSIQVGEQTSIH
jgi:hypothetical protein